MLQFRETCGPVIILTNAPRPSSIIPAQLDRLGLPREAYDCVVTSGDATRAEIAKFEGAPALRIGPDKDDALFEGLDVNFTSLEKAAFIVCTGLVDDQSETPEDYRPLLTIAAEKQLPMVCANPDIIVNWGGRRIWCAGALAEIYQGLGGDVIFGGKPHAPIYELAINAIHEAAGEKIANAKLLCIGDGLGTDIAGANAQSIDAILVSGADGVHDGEHSEADVSARLKEAGVSVKAVMERLAW